MNRDSLAVRWIRIIVPLAVIWAISALVSAGMIGWCRYVLLPRVAEGMDPFQQEAYWRKAYTERRLLITAIGDALIILYGLFEMRRDRGDDRVPPFRVTLPARFLLWMPAIGAAACLFVNLVFSVSGLAQLLAGDYEQMTEVLFPEGQELLTVVTVGLLAPVAEETVFRGVIFPRLRGTYRGLVPAVFSAVLFGAFHGNVAQGLYAFFLGLVFALCMEFTGSFRAALVLHMCANLCSAFMTIFAASFSFAQVMMALALSGIVLCAGIGRLSAVYAGEKEKLTAGRT